MSNLAHWQSKIQEKRKTTPWRDFVMEIASWFPLSFSKNGHHISILPPHIPNVVGIKEYREKYSNTLYPKNENTTKDFFATFREVFHQTPKMSVTQFRTNENVSYANCVFGAKNAYLSFVVGLDAENVMHSAIVYEHCTNIFDSNAVTSHCSNIYHSKMITNSYNVFYSKCITNSSNIRFCANCTNCQYCLECDGLENVSYYYRNKSYKKEEYMTIDNESIKHKENFVSLYKLLNNNAINYNAQNIQGNRIINSSDVINGYNVSRLVRGHNVAYIEGVNGCEDFYDVFECGVNSKYFVGVCNAGDGDHVYCSNLIDKSSNIYYSYHLDTCSFCLGCVGLLNKQFCIFNQQYTKEEWHIKVDEIFSQMERDGVFGDFFPPAICPFYFNDTVAYLIDSSFTKEEISAKGYLWRDEPIKVDIPEGSRLVLINELDQYEGWMIDGKFTSLAVIAKDETIQLTIKDPSTTVGMTQTRRVDPSILNCIIQDESGNVYRIVKMEYDFLMKHGLPLPRKHRLDRMKENFTINS